MPNERALVRGRNHCAIGERQASVKRKADGHNRFTMPRRLPSYRQGAHVRYMWDLQNSYVGLFVVTDPKRPISIPAYRHSNVTCIALNDVVIR